MASKKKSRKAPQAGRIGRPASDLPIADVVRRRKEGASLLVLAGEFGRSRETIRKALIAEGHDTGTSGLGGGKGGRKWDELTKAERRRLDRLIAKKASLDEMALAVGISAYQASLYRALNGRAS